MHKNNILLDERTPLLNRDDTSIYQPDSGNNNPRQECSVVCEGGNRFTVKIYPQDLAHTQQYQEWSVILENDEDYLDHTTQRTWCQNFFCCAKVDSEVCFAQMVDAVAHLKDKRILDFSFSVNCSREEERIYRLFIIAHNKLRDESGNKPPILRVSSTDARHNISGAEIEAAKIKIQHQLASLFIDETPINNASTSTYNGRG